MPATHLPAPHPGNTIPTLDGLRAIALLTIFFTHSGLEHFIPGGMAVTLFFGISGFLITTLMRIEYAQRGRLDLKRFYMRRGLRLLPPLFIVTAAVGLAGATGLINGRFTALGVAAVLGYFGNYFLIAHDFNGMPGGLGVVWTLAIEEHYYLCFPPLALLLLHIGRVRVTAALLGGLCAVVLAWRFWLVNHGASVDYLTMATDTRIDATLLGSMLALVRSPWLDRELPLLPFAPRLPAWFIASLCFAALAWSLIDRQPDFRATWRYTLQSLAVIGLIHLAVTHSKHRAVRWLDAAPLVYLGTVSYSVYLVHHVFLLGVAKHWPQGGWFGVTLAAALGTLAVAEPMRRWVEQPCARLRQRLHRVAPATAPAAAPSAPVVARSWQ
jgi:peptidoglycan/LPS O-acetylase OafA/YrhL